jgi:hypothetical protein
MLSKKAPGGKDARWPSGVGSLSMKWIVDITASSSAGVTLSPMYCGRYADPPYRRPVCGQTLNVRRDGAA